MLPAWSSMVGAESTRGAIGRKSVGSASQTKVSSSNHKPLLVLTSPAGYFPFFVAVSNVSLMVVCATATLVKVRRQNINTNVKILKHLYLKSAATLPFPDCSVSLLIFI